MKGKFKYNFDRSNGVMYKRYFGPITLGDITSSWLFAFENNLIPKNANGFILDYSNAIFSIDIGSHHKIADFYKDHLNVFGGKKIAIVATIPQNVVVPILVNTKDDGYISKPFSTLNAALNWVLA